MAVPNTAANRFNATSRAARRNLVIGVTTPDSRILDTPRLPASLFYNHGDDLSLPSIGSVRVPGPSAPRADPDPDADQVPRRPLPGERLLRPLLRHLPQRPESRRRACL